VGWAARGRGWGNKSAPAALGAVRRGWITLF